MRASCDNPWHVILCRNKLDLKCMHLLKPAPSEDTAQHLRKIPHSPRLRVSNLSVPQQAACRNLTLWLRVEGGCAAHQIRCDHGHTIRCSGSNVLACSYHACLSHHLFSSRMPHNTVPPPLRKLSMRPKLCQCPHLRPLATTTDNVGVAGHSCTCRGPALAR